MEYSFIDFIALLGAVGLFLYGMKVMSEGLQKAAGSQLRSILSAMTRTRALGVLTGVVITALIQSSSASVTMVVSFVNARLMSLAQSMAVIMGANLGTTFTDWLVVLGMSKFDISTILFPLLALAVPMLFFRSSKWKSVGELLIGFVLVFMALDAISDNVPNLQDSPETLAALQNYASMGFLSLLIFTFVGLVVTMVIQSSAATFALVMILSGFGWVPFDMACAMVLGASIGTCITPLLASLGGNTEAKRAAAGHVLFNALGACWALPVFLPFVKGISWMCVAIGWGDPNALNSSAAAGSDPAVLASQKSAMMYGLALFHTVYKIVNLLVMIWFTGGYVKIVSAIVKGRQVVDEEFQLKYISGGLLSAAELNIAQAQREITVYAQRVEKMLGMVKELVHTKTGTVEFNRLFTRIGKYEDISDRMEIEIAKYLNSVVDGRLSLEAKLRVSSMLNIISEIESIADSCNNIAKTLVRKEEANAHFNDYNYANIDEMLRLVTEAMSNMLVVLSDVDDVTGEDLITSYNKEREINNFRNLCRTENIENINQKKYPYSAGIFYMDIICEAEKLGDFIVNVIDSVEEMVRRASATTANPLTGELNPEKTAKA